MDEPELRGSTAVLAVEACQLICVQYVGTPDPPYNDSSHLDSNLLLWFVFPRCGADVVPSIRVLAITLHVLQMVYS